MNAPRLSGDQEAGALYVQFSDEPVISTVELSPSVYVDLNAKGNVVGFEILNADSELLAALSRLSQPVPLGDLLRR
jgi:uncharacterized protein YuzE